jgi:hypothetical protein
MGRAIAVGSWPQNQEIGLRIVLVIEPERVLDAHERSIAETLGDVSREHVDHGGVQDADRRRVYDLPIDELDTRGAAKNASLSHPAIVSDREPMADRAGANIAVRPTIGFNA